MICLLLKKNWHAVDIHGSPTRAYKAYPYNKILLLLTSHANDQ